MRNQRKIVLDSILAWLLWTSSALADALDEQDEQIASSSRPTDGGRAGTIDSNNTKSIAGMIECHIWLGPSTLQGAGLGMFAGRDFVADEVLAEDLVIPITDFLLHNDDETNFVFLWDEYTWHGESVLTDHECYSDCSGASPGFGATANSFLPLVNVEEGWPRRNSANLHRSKDPGVGAFTEYHARQSTAKKNINMGEEFFVDYGHEWFTGRDYLGPIPLYRHLDEASELFRQFRRLENSVAIHHSSAEEIMNELWDVFVRHTEFTSSRIFGSFRHDDPDEHEDLDEYMGNVSELRRKQSTRSLEWLQKHGTCGDHIVPGLSTLPQAGRGAIANRDLPVGTVVAQLPLIHITQRHRLDTYPLVEGDWGTMSPDKSGPTSSQLLLNYCYGHAESSVLLCPYGPGVNYVNHNQTQANVRIRWGDSARGNHMPHLLEMPLEELESDKTAKLAFEMVAIKPIFKGDEVFLDYGDAWEMAWQMHVQNWRPVPGAESYVPAFQLQRSGTRFKTVFEQYHDPYPPNVEVQAIEQFFHDDWEESYFDGTLTIDYSGGRRRVDILRYEEHEGHYFYTVVEHYGDELYEDLPHEAFRFVDLPQTTDMYLANAFRHDIRIPDDIFPNAWKNVGDSFSE